MRSQHFSRVLTQDGEEFQITDNELTAAVWRTTVESGWHGTAREWRGELRDDLGNALESWDAPTKHRAIDQALDAIDRAIDVIPSA